MPIDTILIDARPGQTRAALLEEGRLVELALSRDDLETVAGNVYLGRVETVVPRLDAAFVDIGLERSGFLGLSDVRPFTGAKPKDRIGDYLCEGDAVLVQVLRDPEGDKGAKLTTRVSLPGRSCVFLAQEPVVRLSKSLVDGDIRALLDSWARPLVHEGEGLLVRANALAAGEEGLRHEVETLRHAWAAIEKAAAAAHGPARLHVDVDPARRALRDAAGPYLQRVLVEGAPTFNALKSYCSEWMPGLLDRISVHAGPEPLFEAEGVEEQIEAALGSEVPLPGGGNLVIEETAALVAIDVNSGRAQAGGREDTALAVNLEAAEAVARELRLRNLAGLVAIDFLRLKNRHHRQQVLDALRAAVERDSVSVNVAGYTVMGLVELTRRKKGESLSRLLGGACPACRGEGLVASPLTVAYEILRVVPREARAEPGARFLVRAAPQVVGALNGPARAALEDVESRLGRPLELEPDGALAPDVYEIAAIR